VPAPGGICESCRKPVQWTFAEGPEVVMLVRCRTCGDLFDGIDVAGESVREGMRRGDEGYA